MKVRFATLILFLLLFTAVPTTAKDTWVRVRTPNFNLIGNAKEKEIREVATKLEQFRATFRSLFPNARFNQTIETNVIVFKSVKSYKPFLPKRADGKADKGIAGYFQSGEDVNYITLSTAGKKQETYGTIFHEYVHFLMNTNFGRSVVPPWFNEGLAEYYQTFEIEKNNIKVKLGLLQENHLEYLKRNKLIPLRDFFKIDNFALHSKGGHSRSIFYAQAWALIHYLIQGKQLDNLSKFLGLVMNDIEPETAFRQTFGIDYKTMEKNLRKYVRRNSFVGTYVTFNRPLVFDSKMTVTQLSESEANAYLGDLLYHTHEYEDAEVYLKKSLALDSNQSLANTALGLVKMRQGKYEEAKSYLEKAISGGQRNHMAHYNYAYVLSRESYDEFGYVSRFPEEKALKMRQSLVKAITIKPNFTASYSLLAFINYVNNEKLDQAISYLKRAIALQPGNQQYSLRIAQIYLRQSKIAEAEKLALQLSKTAVESEIREGARSVLSTIKTLKESQARIENNRRDLEAREISRPILKRRSKLSVEDLEKIAWENAILDVNREIKEPKDGEKQTIGYIEKISCVNGGVKYSVKTKAGNLTLMSKDFQELQLIALVEEAERISVGCDAKVQNILAVLTYREETDAKMGSQGYLVSMAFVPKFFKLKSKEELVNAKRVTVVDDTRRTVPENVRPEIKDRRRNALMNAIKTRLRQPAAGEKRGVGYLELIECKRKYQVFHVKMGSEILKLKVDRSNNLKIVGYTRDAQRVNLRCGSRPPVVTAVITYRPSKKSKKINGDIVSLEFVPKGFKL